MPARHANSHTIAVSRPGVHALRGWGTWAAITGTEINLAAIRRRINDAGLGYRP